MRLELCVKWAWHNNCRHSKFKQPLIRPQKRNLWITGNINNNRRTENGQELYQTATCIKRARQREREGEGQKRRRFLNAVSCSMLLRCLHTQVPVGRRNVLYLKKKEQKVGEFFMLSLGMPCSSSRKRLSWSGTWKIKTETIEKYRLNTKTMMYSNQYLPGN